MARESAAMDANAILHSRHRVTAVHAAARRPHAHTKSTQRASPIARVVPSSRRASRVVVASSRRRVVVASRAVVRHHRDRTRASTHRVYARSRDRAM